MSCIVEYIPWMILAGILGFLFAWAQDKLDGY